MSEEVFPQSDPADAMYNAVLDHMVTAENVALTSAVFDVMNLHQPGAGECVTCGMAYPCNTVKRIAKHVKAWTTV